jgi:hypothetical protein
LCGFVEAWGKKLFLNHVFGVLDIGVWGQQLTAS